MVKTRGEVTGTAPREPRDGVRAKVARFGATIALMIGAPLQCAYAQRPSPACDLLLRGGTVVDGTGAAGRRADVAIVGDRIVRVAAPGLLAPSGARRVIDVSDLVIAPGFIDLHAHTNTLRDTPAPENFLRPGITTTIASLHSQDQPWPLAAYACSLGVA
nr:hypothetical protein [Gemmatimonadaceae bacterium]